MTDCDSGSSEGEWYCPEEQEERKEGFRGNSATFPVVLLFCVSEADKGGKDDCLGNSAFFTEVLLLCSAVEDVERKEGFLGSKAFFTGICGAGGEGARKLSSPVILGSFMYMTSSKQLS